jgi:hypothetical protein
MKYKTAGTILLVAGILVIASTLFFLPFEGLPGSSSMPYTASQIMSPSSISSLSKDTQEPQEYYVETKTISPQVLSIAEKEGKIIPMTYPSLSPMTSQYHKSYVYRSTLSPQQVSKLSYQEQVVGVWKVPDVKYMFPRDLAMNTDTDLGDMSDSLFSTKVSLLHSQGIKGNNTIIAIIDDFPSQEKFYDFFPSSWSDRIIHYPNQTSSSAQHGIMTTSIASEVAPKAKLYLMHYNQDPVELFHQVLSLQDEYPDHDIVCSNSYIFTGVTYYSPESVINRKILELTDNDIAVLFAAGNFAHSGEHNSQWTLNVGYDSRNSYFDEDEEIGYPATFDSVISVAGTNSFSDKILSYSSIGRGVGSNMEPDVAAPTHFPYVKSPYLSALGTSASCPFMAGVCSLILSQHDAENRRLVGSIHSYSVDLGEEDFDIEFGYGAVDADKLNNNYEDWTPPPQESNGVMFVGAGIVMVGVGLVLRRRRSFEEIIR